MHGWHLAEPQEIGMIVMQPGRFFTQECLQGREWWNCPENHCPWHVEKKKRIYYWPGSKGSVAYKESGKGEA